jgi:hypothetical protein
VLRAELLDGRHLRRNNLWRLHPAAKPGINHHQGQTPGGVVNNSPFADSTVDVDWSYVKASVVNNSAGRKIAQNQRCL